MDISIGARLIADLYSWIIDNQLSQALGSNQLPSIMRFAPNILANLLEGTSNSREHRKITSQIDNILTNQKQTKHNFSEIFNKLDKIAELVDARISDEPSLREKLEANLHDFNWLIALKKLLDSDSIGHVDVKLDDFRLFSFFSEFYIEPNTILLGRSTEPFGNNFHNSLNIKNRLFEATDIAYNVDESFPEIMRLDFPSKTPNSKRTKDRITSRNTLIQKAEEGCDLFVFEIDHKTPLGKISTRKINSVYVISGTKISIHLPQPHQEKLLVTSICDDEDQVIANFIKLS